MTEIECMTEYSLIPVEACNNNTEEELEETTNRSAIYINNIQHESAENINITIPDELEREYTNESWTLDINIIWYNVDNDYIASIIENEKLTPTAEDMTYLVQNLGSYIPLLCIAGLMIRARYIIKKVF